MSSSKLRESGIWFPCPHCEGSIQFYPGMDIGYFAKGKRTDVCQNCGHPLRLVQDVGSEYGYDLALGSWNEWEFRNLGLSGCIIVRTDDECDEEDSGEETKRISA